MLVLQAGLAEDALRRACEFGRKRIAWDSISSLLGVSRFCNRRICDVAVLLVERHEGQQSRTQGGCAFRQRWAACIPRRGSWSHRNAGKGSRECDHQISQWISCRSKSKRGCLVVEASPWCLQKSKSKRRGKKTIRQKQAHAARCVRYAGGRNK